MSSASCSLRVSQRARLYACASIHVDALPSEIVRCGYRRRVRLGPRGTTKAKDVFCTRPQLQQVMPKQSRKIHSNGNISRGGSVLLIEGA